LCANVALNSLVNVLTRHAGVGATRGELRLPVIDPRKSGNYGAMKIEGYREGEPVDLLQIDALNLPRCDVMKIDVEGMETQVLQGARNTIQKFQPILFIENDTVERSRELLNTIFALDYVGYWQTAPFFNPANYFGHQEDVFAAYQPEANVLCFHRSRPSNIEGMEPITGPDDNWQLAWQRLQQRLAAK
jgi:hypothetical protein